MTYKRNDAIDQAIASIQLLDRLYCGAMIEDPDQLQKFKRLYFEFTGLCSRVPDIALISSPEVYLEMRKEDLIKACHAHSDERNAADGTAQSEEVVQGSQP